MVYIGPNTIISSDSIVKQISRQILLILKPNKVNLASIPLNASIVKVIIKLIPKFTCFSATDLTRNGILRSTKNFATTKTNQFAQF